MTARQNEKALTVVRGWERELWAPEGPAGESKDKFDAGLEVLVSE